jgi:putative oxidoreductase
MKSFNHFLFLKIALIAVFVMHGIPSIVTGDVNNFGKMYLDQVGFAPVGIYLAWLIKLSHITLCISIVVNKYLKPIGWINIGILLVGIFILHIKDGWYVVGGGRNGVEFNVLLIAALLTIMYPKIVLFKSESKNL